jgi:hypothetical protein
MNVIASRIFLGISALIACGIGGAMLLDPVAFEASSGLVLVPNPSLLSELRASGANLLALGLLMGAGIAVRSLTFTSLVVATVLYLAYGLGRGIGIAVDGLPVAGLVTAMVVELGIGGVGITLLVRRASRSHGSMEHRLDADDRVTA